MRSTQCVVLVVACGCGRVSFDPRTDLSTDGSNDAFEPISPHAGFPLNEGSGQVVSNTISSAAGGMLGAMPTVDVQDPTWTAGHFGSALTFDPTDDRVYIPYSPDLYDSSVAKDAITISAWIRPSPASGFRVAFEIGGESNGATVGIVDTGALRFALRNVQGAQTSKVLDTAMTVAPNAWYYVAATSDARGMDLRVYDIGGALLERASASNQFAWRTGSDGIAIGNNPEANSGLRGVLDAGQEPFAGIVDEVRVYDIAISEAQILADLTTPL